MTDLTTDAYSGAILFVAFMAEMRHPMDFWKGMICAQAFICSVYILFGAYVSVACSMRSRCFKLKNNELTLSQVYSNYGQYAISNIQNVIQPLALQTVANVFTLLTGFIACGGFYFSIPRGKCTCAD